MIHSLALLYVKVLVPSVKVLAVVLVVAFVLYLFNLLRGGDSKNDFIGTVVTGVMKGVIKFIQLVWKSLLVSFKMLLKTISLIFATVSDFLTSKI